MNPCFSYYQYFALIDNAELPANIFTHVYLQTSASVSIEHIRKREMLSKVYVNLCSVCVFSFIYAFLRATNIYFLTISVGQAFGMYLVQEFT